MRAPSGSWSWLNRTSFLRTAVKSLTGTFTSPKLMAPLQIDLGTDKSLPRRPWMAALSRVAAHGRGADPAWPAGAAERERRARMARRETVSEPARNGLSPHLARFLVVPQPFVGRMAHGAVGGPFAEIDVGHQAGFDIARHAP